MTSGFWSYFCLCCSGNFFVPLMLNNKKILISIVINNQMMKLIRVSNLLRTVTYEEI